MNLSEKTFALNGSNTGLAYVYNKKVTKAGNYYEVREYARPTIAGFRVERESTVRRKNAERRVDNIARSRNRLIRRVLSNSQRVKPIFVTLTYAENMVDRLQAIQDVKRFIRDYRLVHGDIKYLYVLEKQERGAWHVHMLIFNRSYWKADEIREMWEKGRVNVKSTNDAKHVAFYLGKYLGKDVSEGNKRSYSMSRNLLTHEEFHFFMHINGITIPKNCVYSGAYFTPTGNFVNINIYYDDRRNIS